MRNFCKRQQYKNTGAAPDCSKESLRFKARSRFKLISGIFFVLQIIKNSLTGKKKRRYRTARYGTLKKTRRITLFFIIIIIIILLYRERERERERERKKKKKEKYQAASSGPIPSDTSSEPEPRSSGGEGPVRNRRDPARRKSARPRLQRLRLGRPRRCCASHLPARRAADGPPGDPSRSPLGLFVAQLRCCSSIAHSLRPARAPGGPSRRQVPQETGSRRSRPPMDGPAASAAAARPLLLQTAIVGRHLLRGSGSPSRQRCLRKLRQPSRHGSPSLTPLTAPHPERSEATAGKTTGPVQAEAACTPERGPVRSARK